LSEMNRKDHFIDQPEQSKTDSRFSQVEPLGLARDGEGSRGYRMIALAAMLILAAAALIFWFYLRS
jgi:hypothetical protein